MADITYNKINWENEPSHNTPLSAENLNKMDTAIYDLVTKSNSLVPNPAESPTEGLEKLEYDGTVYEVKGGHKILNDSGSVLTQMDNMQFNGVYTHNASTITEVDIVREFQSVAEIEALTGEAQKGFQVVQDAEDYIPFTASENIFDNTNTSFTGDNVQDVLEEVDNKKLSCKQINEQVTSLAISGSIGSLYYADYSVDISSLNLTNAPTKVLVSYVIDSGVANNSSPISVVVASSTSTSVLVRFIRPDNNKSTTGDLTIFIFD